MNQDNNSAVSLFIPRPEHLEEINQSGQVLRVPLRRGLGAPEPFLLLPWRCLMQADLLQALGMCLLLCLEVPGVVPCPCTGSLLFLWSPLCWNTSLGAPPELGAAFMTPRRWQVIIHPVTSQYTLLLLLLHHFEWRSSWLTGEILVWEPLCARPWNLHPCTQPAPSAPPELSAHPDFPELGTAPGSRTGAELTLLSVPMVRKGSRAPQVHPRTTSRASCW